MPPGDASNAFAFIFSPHQTPLRSAPSLFPFACQAVSHKGSRARAGRPPRSESTTRRLAAAGRALPRRVALRWKLPVSPLHRCRSTLSSQAPRTLSWKRSPPECSRRVPYPAMNSGRRHPAPTMNGGRRGPRVTRDSSWRGPRPTKCCSRRAKSLRSRRDCVKRTCDSKSGSPCSSRPRRARRRASTLRPTTRRRHCKRFSSRPWRPTGCAYRAASPRSTRRSWPPAAQTSLRPSRL